MKTPIFKVRSKKFLVRVKIVRKGGQKVIVCVSEAIGENITELSLEEEEIIYQVTLLMTECIAIGVL